MDDRELLELAAKAAGIGPIIGWEIGALKIGPNAMARFWNPLNDDGQAMGLARSLNMSIDFEDCTVWRRMSNHHLVQEFWGGDHGSESHAIVRAAVEIGKAMP